MKSISFFAFLVFFVFCSTIFYTTYNSQIQSPWRIQPDQWDTFLFHNNERYIVEGKGAMKIFLGYPESEIFRIWGQPTYRENSTIEKLHYRLQHVKGFFLLKKGFIRLIRIYIPKDSVEDFYPFTALGFGFQTITSNTKTETIKKILQLYPKAPHVILDNNLFIHSRGITYGFYKNRLSYIEVYQPEHFNF